MVHIKQYKPKEENIKKLELFLKKINNDGKENKRIRNGNNITKH